MLRIAICDDEVCFISKLQNYLWEYFSEKEILYNADVFESGIQLLELGERLCEIDIIFLDINMKDLNGIETAKQIRNFTQETFIVFVTGYITYSPEGYKVNAIRYILKDIENFKVAFVECLNTIQDKIKDKQFEQIIEFSEGKKKIILNNIVYIESDLHKLYFHIWNNKEVRYTMYGRLDTLEEKIQLSGFCRIHKSYLVNLRYVEDLQRYHIILNNGHELSVAKQRYKEVENKYISFKGAI